MADINISKINFNVKKTKIEGLSAWTLWCYSIYSRGGTIMARREISIKKRGTNRRKLNVY